MSHVLLTDEQAQQIEEALKRVINDWVAPDDLPFEDGEMPALDGAREALATIQAALAEPQITTPDVCGEVCARAKLCYGCNKDLEEANAKFADQAEQEPVHEALQIASVAFQDIACSSQTENLYWWQLRARKAQKQIAECLTNAAPVEPVKQEPVAEVVVRPLRGDQSQPTTDIKWLQRPTAGKLYAVPVRTKDLTAKWIDPNDKSQKQYLPHIGEKVLFCCDGEVYYGHHTGGSFQKGYGVTKSLFPTWDCMWMPLPAAAVATDLEKNK